MEYRVFKMICLVAALAQVQGCGSGRQECAPVQFPQVDVPSYINDREQAVNYMSRKYWDKFFAVENPCTSDSSAVHGVDSLSFEEAFSLYARLLTMADAKSVAASEKKLFANLDSLALLGDRKPLLCIMERMEHYFYNPVSPLLDEEIYLQALNGILAARSLNETDKMQYEYQHRICSMNRMGTPAADFKFRQLLPSGRYSDKTLYMDVKGEYTLLFFNNPDCGSCAEILQAMKDSPIGALVQEGRLEVLAMYIDEDLAAWYRNRDKYPAGWIYAHDPEMILRDNNIYGLRAIPSLYLLDKEKRVILKDAPVDKVISWFLQNRVI
ncbi:MAG: DUF5106 domain-containing protein [Bacteroidales bacterium]|nr:DUF5106 domain-containing protein [Bacteroidales bacterium]